MTATHTSTRPAPHVRLFGRFVVIALFTVSLITTGCDFVDSNTVMDEAPMDESRHLLMSTDTFHQVAQTEAPLDETRLLLALPTETLHHVTQTEAPCVKVKQGGAFVCLNEDGANRYVGPPNIVPLWHNLVGTWQYVEAGVRSNKTVTFTLDQRIRVETVCQTHEGPFSSESKDQLSIAQLTLIHQTCAPLVEDPLMGMLEAATGYRVQDGRLLINSTQSGPMLRFNAAGGGDADGSAR